MSTLKSGSDQNGKVVYNAGIVKGIVALAVAEVEGTLPLRCFWKRTAFMRIFPSSLNMDTTFLNWRIVFNNQSSKALRI